MTCTGLDREVNFSCRIPARLKIKIEVDAKRKGLTLAGWLEQAAEREFESAQGHPPLREVLELHYEI